MTLHCAITYFDSESRTMGYLIGADGCTAVKELPDLSFSSDKSIRGTRSVGFRRGSYKTGFLTDAISAIEESRKSLENMFDDITDRKDYSEICALNNMDCSFLVARQADDFVGLYVISKYGDDAHKAIEMYRITPSLFDLESSSFGVLALCNTDCCEFKIDGLRLDYSAALKTIYGCLTLYNIKVDGVILDMVGSNYQPGVPTIFKVDQKEIRQVKDFEMPKE